MKIFLAFFVFDLSTFKGGYRAFDNDKQFCVTNSSSDVHHINITDIESRYLRVVSCLNSSKLNLVRNLGSLSPSREPYKRPSPETRVDLKILVLILLLHVFAFHNRYNNIFYILSIVILCLAEGQFVTTYSQFRISMRLIPDDIQNPTGDSTVTP